MTSEIQPGIYVHFSGDRYLVIAIGHVVLGSGATENPGESMVIYRALYTSKNFGPDHYWTRSVSNFLEQVEVEGVLVPRFRRVEPLLEV